MHPVRFLILSGLLFLVSACVVVSPHIKTFVPPMTGQVMDAETGTPIPGVRVIAHVPGMEMEPVETRTDADGRYDLAAVSEFQMVDIIVPTGAMGFSNVYFVAPGYAVQAETYQYMFVGRPVDELAAGREVNLRLERLTEGDDGPPPCPPASPMIGEFPFECR